MLAVRAVSWPEVVQALLPEQLTLFQEVWADQRLTIAFFQARLKQQLLEPLELHQQDPQLEVEL